MITPSFGLTATERVLPRLALDFTTASLDSRVTFTRSGNTATVINSSGLIEAVNADIPRFDHTLNTGGACKGLLIEESRTNLALYSEQFDNAYWEKTTAGTASAPVVTQNAGVAPDGATTAEQVDFNCGSTVSDRSILRKAFTISNTTAYSGSLYIKAAAAEDIGKTVRFRTENVGAAVTITLTSSWQRVASNGTSSSTTCNWVIETRGTLTSQTASVLLWGGQFELGAFETSYIPTEATAVTRNADVATMTGTNFSDWYNASEGTLVLQNQYLDVPTGSGRAPVQLLSDANNFMQIYLRLGTVNGALGQSAGVTQWVNNGSTASALPFRTAFAYKTNDIEMATNGATIFTDTLATIPTVNQLVFPSVFCGLIQKLNYYPLRLTSSELKAFSKQ